MIFLKLQGYTNQKISYSVRGTWAESTIKLYTRGMVVGKKSALGVPASSALMPLIEGRVTPDDVLHANSLKARLDAEGISLEEVIFVIDQARTYGMSIASALASYHNLLVSGLTTNNISQILAIRREMEDNDISINELGEILRKGLMHGKDKFLNHLRSLS